MPRAKLIPISQVKVEDQALRFDTDAEDIVELAADIAQKGLLQPVGVRELECGGYQLLWGGRRLAAHRRLGLESIWAHVYEGPGESVKAVALVENIQRLQLSLAEECEAVRYLHVEEGKSVEQISAVLSKSRTWVLQRLCVLDLPEFLQRPVLEGALPLGHLEELAKVKDEGAVRYLASMAIANRWTRAQLRQAAEPYTLSAGFDMAERGAEAPPGPGRSPAEPVYFCQACGLKGKIEDFVVVRVCKYGCRSGAIGDRSGDAGSSVDGLGGGGGGQGGGQNPAHD